MNISIIGENSTLANALQSSLNQTNNVECFGREKYNFLNKDSVVKIVDQIKQSDVVINCVGVIDCDIWDSFLINTVAPCYLLEKLIEKKSKAHVINIGSHGAMWTSWPGISMNRLNYNVSKNALQSFVTGLAQSSLGDLKLTLMNLSSFKSDMSNNQGYDINLIVDSILYVINKPVLIYEFNNYKNDQTD